MPKNSDDKDDKKVATLCDWSKKELRERFDDLCAAVRSPRYACLKCGRAAADKRLLCKAKSLSSG